MKKNKIEIKLDSSQFELLSQELEGRHLSIEELVTDLIQQHFALGLLFDNPHQL